MEEPFGVDSLWYAARHTSHRAIIADDIYTAALLIWDGFPAVAEMDETYYRPCHVPYLFQAGKMEYFILGRDYEWCQTTRDLSFDLDFCLKWGLKAHLCPLPEKHTLSGREIVEHCLAVARVTPARPAGRPPEPPAVYLGQNGRRPKQQNRGKYDLRGLL